MNFMSSVIFEEVGEHSSSIFKNTEKQESFFSPLLLRLEEMMQVINVSNNQYPIWS